MARRQELDEQERKRRSKKRLFWAFVAADVALAGFLFYEIISMFLH